MHAAKDKKGDQKKKTPFREPAAMERTQGCSATVAVAKETTPAAAAVDGRGRPWSWRNKIKHILQGNLGRSRRTQDLLY
jgi:hypothetical protein